MRKEAWRFDTDAYDFHFDIAPRYTDLDTWRHVNNVAAHQMHLEGRMRHQMHLLGPATWYADDVHLRPRRVTTHFLRVTHYPDTVRCGVTLRGVQSDSYVLSVALFQGDACVGLQECLMGAWRNDAPVELPGDARRMLEEACRSPQGNVESPSAPESAAAEGDYPVVAEVLARYADLDADSRLGEAALARYMEQARSTVIRHVGLGDLGLVVASVDIVNHSWRPVGGTVMLPTGISHIGRSSFVVRSIALRRDRQLALSDSTMVVTNQATGRPRAMPEDFRRQLAEFRLPGD